MKDFLNSVRFKVLACIVLFLFGLMLRAGTAGGFAIESSSIIGAVVSPIQKLSTIITNGTRELISTLVDTGSVKRENQKLKDDVNELRQKVIDYNNLKNENDLYKEYLGIKGENPDFVFEPAIVIGRDPTQLDYSFTIDKGSLAGVKPKDTVISKDGLVGVVSEVGLTYSKVSTILDVTVNVGAYNSRTREDGVLGGSVELSSQGLCKMSYLSRDSLTEKGDIISTSGLGGIYPKGIVIGMVTELKLEQQGISMYAIIETAADCRNIKDVLIIKSFFGQGGLVSAADEGNAS